LGRLFNGSAVPVPADRNGARVGSENQEPTRWKGRVAMGSGLPARITMLLREEVRAAKNELIAGRLRQALEHIEVAELLAEKADNGIASGFVDIRVGLGVEEMMERRLAREARQVRAKRRAALTATAAD
jgi:hypothetical protein